MSGQNWPFGLSGAVSALRQLLMQGEYKVAWMRHVQRHSKKDPINRLAVARLLFERHVFPEGITFDAIKETVYRALNEDSRRQVLTPDTLTRFVDGFGMTAEHAAILWAALAGVDAAGTDPVTDTLAPSVDVARLSAGPRLHTTISLHELHTVGADGLPAHNRTVQVIRALADGLRTYPFLYDTDAATVAVVRGGRVGEPIRSSDGVLHGVQIELTRSVPQGDTASIEYETTFHYRQQPPPELRRAALGRTSNLELYVRFHRARLPRHVWWATWDHYGPDANIVTEEPRRLDAELSVHQYLPYIQRAVVGFHWSF